MAQKQHQKQKAQKPLLGLRRVVATNIQGLLDRDYSGSPRGQIGRFRKDHKSIPLSKIQRAVQEGALNMASIEQFAKAFNVHPYQLFIEGLNVEAPQVAVNPDVHDAVEKLRQMVGESGRETQRERAAGRRDDAQTRHPST